MKKTKIALLVLLCLAPGVTLGQTDSAPERMNVLFLVVDDLNTWLLGDQNRYTGKVVAPNIQRLADSGVNFLSNYTASPKCSPSRTAVLSGVAPWKSGLWENSQDIHQSKLITGAPQLPSYFKRHGYYTAKSGKVSHGYSQDDSWDEELKGVGQRTESPPNAPLNGWAKSASGRPTETDWGLTHRQEGEMNDAVAADFAIQQLQKDHNKPFFIACGMFHPHMPWYVPQKYLDMYPLEDIAIPEFDKNDLDDVPPLGQAFSNVKTVDKILEHNQHKAAVQGYLASTSFADAQVGRVSDALEKSPYRDNTIVVLWSDHGFHLGEKMHWQKGTLWEEATNSLLMFRVPGVTSPKGRCSQLVSLLDIYPTLVEMCGLPDPGHLDGQSLLALLKNPAAQHSTHVITAYDGQIAVRTAQHRYIRYSDGSDELYDRSKDPHEWVNQSNNPEYGAIKKQLNGFLPALGKMPPAIPFKSKPKKKD